LARGPKYSEENWQNDCSSQVAKELNVEPNPGRRGKKPKLLDLWHGPQALVLYLSEISSNVRLCGLVVRVPGYRSRGPDSIPGFTRFSEK
jgi:hypothetical protein